ncbi:MAG: methylmalonyl Co-A mutase-associated GTPase MeaB [Acidobacteriota bacterium]
MKSIVEGMIAGDERSIARAITIIEEEPEIAAHLLKDIFPYTGRAFIIGITGAPGVGKSTLVDKIAERYRREGKKIGIIAVDPSSAFSGGAILGDRVRMQRHNLDSGVFIRSMATRGQMGGLSRFTGDAIDILDAAGKDVIIIETVGVGQDEIDIVSHSDSVVVVLIPGMGDDIQAIKAGILEIADIFAVNKADQPGADRVVSELEYLFTMLTESVLEMPEIIKTEALYDSGIDLLVEAIEKRHQKVIESGLLNEKRMERCENRLVSILRERLLNEAMENVLKDGRYHEYVNAIFVRRIDPYSAVEEIMKGFGRREQKNA